MLKMYLATDEGFVSLHSQNGQWKPELHLADKNVQCLAYDPQHPAQIYAGTFGQGVWRSHDAGSNWEHLNNGIQQEQIMSIAISDVDYTNGYGITYVGTEPSFIYRSEDNGKSWQELNALRQLPSAPTWSFPPRPYTSHVRYITPDPLVSGRVFAAIEAGALLRSLDGGDTWEDRKPGAPLDTHTLIMHRLAPDRLYSAAGDGFMHPGQGYSQSEDGGETWIRPDEGLQHHYLWSLAVDPQNPDTLVVSAAHSPSQAHNPQQAQSALYQRTGKSPWQQIHAGIPKEDGLLAAVLATNKDEPGVFYATNNKSIWRSSDAGVSWEQLPIDWPSGFHLSRANALAIVSD